MVSDMGIKGLFYTWLSHAAVRTAVNTEAKLLMLAHAFETWQLGSRVLPHRRA